MALTVARKYGIKNITYNDSKKAVRSQPLNKLLKVYTKDAHRTLSCRLFQQFTRRHEKENALELFAHCRLNTLDLPLAWLSIVKLNKLSSTVIMERDISYFILKSNVNISY